jgi:hypothetical protein
MINPRNGDSYPATSGDRDSAIDKDPLANPATGALTSPRLGVHAVDHLSFMIPHCRSGRHIRGRSPVTGHLRPCQACCDGQIVLCARRRAGWSRGGTCVHAVPFHRMIKVCGSVPKVPRAPSARAAAFLPASVAPAGAGLRRRSLDCDRPRLPGPATLSIAGTRLRAVSKPPLPFKCAVNWPNSGRSERLRSGQVSRILRFSRLMLRHQRRRQVGQWPARCSPDAAKQKNPSLPGHSD